MSSSFVLRCAGCAVSDFPLMLNVDSRIAKKAQFGSVYVS